jgi:MYXO-CTERM domain-containing protein
MTRNLFMLAVLAAPLAAVANEPLPGESNDEVVTFEGKATLFKGVDFSWELAPFGDLVKLAFKVDVSSELDYAQEARSSLAWPAVLENSWDQTEKGGVATLTNKGRAWFEITGTVSGVTLGYEIWEASVNWTESFTLNSLLLPGTRQGATRQLNSSGDPIIALTETFDITAGSYITIGASIKPFLVANLTGDAIEAGTTGRVEKTSDVTNINKPSSNQGFVDFNARWIGDFDGVIGFRTTPSLTVKIDSFFVGPIEVPIDLDIFDDAVAVNSAYTQVSHDLPAAQRGVNALDFGQIVMGDKSTKSFTLRNLGNVELVGVATVEGDGFALPPTNLLLARTNNGGPTSQTFDIDLLPTQAGNYAGTLIIHTNDPVNPILTVPMAGVSYDPANPNDPNNPDNPGGSDLITQEGRGCGCSSVNPASGLGGLAALGMLGLVLRRRRA